MCGVAGVVNRSGKKSPGSALLTAMLTAIRHRGPDESGIFTDGKASIGNVRLSIIDLASGQQPMRNEKGNRWIVFNGEIFNYLELKESLIGLGHRFKTSSDTEVLLQLYDHYGADCLSMLNGQFVFAIWDTDTKDLFIARDRVGIRPLYFTEASGDFIFASEIKSILQHPSVTAELNLEALSQLVTFWTPLPGFSIFKNISELQPGHFMRINDLGITFQCYWQLNFASSGKYRNGSLESASAEFHEILQDAVRLRLRSDVPVAAYLSGGLDSSVITSLIKQISPDRLQTFSIGFADGAYDESAYQKEVSTYLSTQHVSFTCNAKDIADVFPKVVWYSESPLFRTAPAPMFLLSEKVRNSGIKVVMTGEGADEILAGYDIFKEDAIRRFWARYPGSSVRPLLFKRLYGYIPQISQMNARMLQFVFGYKLEQTDHPFYAHLSRWNNGSFLRQYFGKEVKDNLGSFEGMESLKKILPEDYNRWDSLSRAQWTESRLLLSNYLLSSQGDRMGMANSIEGRYPFLDYRLIEYASQLPPSYKLKGLNEKFLLKHSMQGQLPSSVLQRSKQAYRAPITQAFLPEKQPEYVRTYLHPDKLKSFGLFDRDLVAQLLQRLQSGRYSSENDTMALTAILSTQLFFAQYIDKSFGLSDPRPPLKPVLIEKYT